jgi:hypothetical protein
LYLNNFGFDAMRPLAARLNYHPLTRQSIWHKKPLVSGVSLIVDFRRFIDNHRKPITSRPKPVNGHLQRR